MTHAYTVCKRTPPQISIQPELLSASTYAPFHAKPVLLYDGRGEWCHCDGMLMRLYAIGCVACACCATSVSLSCIISMTRTRIPTRVIGSGASMATARNQTEISHHRRSSTRTSCTLPQPMFETVSVDEWRVVEGEQRMHDVWLCDICFVTSYAARVTWHVTSYAARVK